MSTQAISDYITKQIFIEKNVVTYRSLSRQFSLHVNAAKNELATYHHNAPYQSQNCSATFLLCGVMKKDSDRNEDEDVDMDGSHSDNIEVHSGMDEDDSDEVPQTCITLVNEIDMEVARAAFDVIHSVHVYSLAPAPLVDAALICDRTDFVRDTDKSKGKEWIASVGRIVADGIKTGPVKKVKPVAPQPDAGPSKTKSITPPKPAIASTTTTIKPGIKKEPSAAPLDKAKENPKGNGKLSFFVKSKETTETKQQDEGKKVKKEESVVDLNKKTFFANPVKKSSTAAPNAVSVKQEKEKEPASRGVKRKSSTTLESRGRTPDKFPPVKEKAASSVRVQGKVVMSDNEDAAPVRSTRRRKSRMSLKSESSGVDSEIEREGRALMDLDDDLVEKASHAPSTAVSELEETLERDNLPVNMKEEDEDVEMADYTPPSKPQPKKRKAKAVIPVGKNGLKKRKIMRTRVREDERGYTYREDYTDWESVDEELQPEPSAKAKTKTKPTKVKEQEEENEEKQHSEKEKKRDIIGTKKTEGVSKSTTSKPKGKVVNSAKAKQMMATFFGPSKRT